MIFRQFALPLGRAGRAASRFDGKMPPFNLGQLNAYKMMFSMKFSMEKQIRKFWIAGFFVPAINATVFNSLLS